MCGKYENRKKNEKRGERAMAQYMVEIKNEEKIEKEKNEEMTTESLFEELFGTKAKVRTFIFLLSHPTYEYTTQDIVKYTGLSRVSVSQALKKFIEYGIVEVTRRVGRAEFYRINVMSPIVEAYDLMDRKITEYIIKRELSE